MDTKVGGNYDTLYIPIPYHSIGSITQHNRPKCLFSVPENLFPSNTPLSALKSNNKSAALKTKKQTEKEVEGEEEKEEVEERDKNTTNPNGSMGKISTIAC